MFQNSFVTKIYIHYNLQFHIVIKTYSSSFLVISYSESRLCSTSCCNLYSLYSCSSLVIFGVITRSLSKYSAPASPHFSAVASVVFAAEL